MFARLPDPPEQKIMNVMRLFREDPRDGKIDLGVGVYKNEHGQTPILRSVKAAEKQLWETEDTKTYVALTGAADFADAMTGLVLGDAVSRDAVATAATPGGTGALRQAFELIHLANPGAAVWLSDPSWGNHPAMLKYLGIATREYAYFDRDAGTLRFDQMMSDLGAARPADVVLLHGCCHNPTGVNLSLDQWYAVTELVLSKGLIPMIDIAYQGFGDGLEDDAFGVRHVAASCPETLIAASCSKNFGVYRERAGIFLAVSHGGTEMKRLQGNVATLNRLNFSFPPDHGARLVTIVLNDPALRTDWQSELEDIRTGMLGLRIKLAAELQCQTDTGRFDFVAHHRGMFSMLGLTEAQILRMREDHAVYAVGDSRINVAGLSEAMVPLLAKAVAAVL